MKDESLRRLRREWMKVAVAWLIVWVLGYLLLQAQWTYAGSWLLLSGLLLGYNLWSLWRFLPENRREGVSAVLPTFGAGNQLTLMRGLLIGLLAGFLFRPWPMGALAWGVVALYLAASLADYFDGYLARRTNHVTQLGGRLDMTFDGQGLMVVSVLAVWWGQLPWWFLSVGLARYLFLFGLWWRERHDLPIYDIPPSVHRRMVAGTLMGIMMVVLWPIVPASMARLMGSIITAVLLLGFTRDWLITSGVIDPADAVYNRVRTFLWRLTTRWLPPVWRVVLVVTMFVILQSVGTWWQPEAWAALIQSWGLPGADYLATGISLIALVCTPCIAAGILGRTLTIPMFFPLGFDIATRGLNLENGLALTAIVWILLLGTGPFSLFPADDRIYMQRPGAD